MREVPVFNRLVRSSAVAGFVCLDSLDPACVSRAHNLIERCGCLRTELRADLLNRTSDPPVVANLPQECDVFLIPAGADPPRHARIIAPMERALIPQRESEYVEVSQARAAVRGYLELCAEIAR
jgi:hypothetical protein